MAADTVRSPATDPGAFAEMLLGRPLWPHQLELARSPARYRVVCAGRQVGKSTALAVVALFEASTRRGITVLVVSAGEVASRRLLEDCAAMAAASPLLAGSVLDETRSSLVLSNGSRILSVPASQRQIRGWPVDLLVVDEAGFIDPEIWRAAEPSIIARPGSRVILSSSPWGGADHFFRQLWQRGMAAPDEQVAAWHWPSTVSPMVDAALLEQIRGREAPLYFAREYLAEWADEAGAYFASAEIDNAVTDEPLAKATALGRTVFGVDWGFSSDASALAVMVESFDAAGVVRFAVPGVIERFATRYSDFVDEVVREARELRPAAVGSETNGVGAMPSQELAARLGSAGFGAEVVVPITTSVRSKEDAFGCLRLWLQQGRVALPRHPALLRQLAALSYEQTESGALRISVPERAGHDDLAMSLALAVGAWRDLDQRKTRATYGLVGLD